MYTADEVDNSWEEVYRANSVRCDIDIVSSPNELGVCPTPLVNPLFFLRSRERGHTGSMLTLDAYV